MLSIEQARKVIQRAEGYEQLSELYFRNDPRVRGEVDAAYKAAYPGDLKIEGEL
jgi:hypothetical protein